MQKNVLDPKKVVERLKWWANAPDGDQALKVIARKTGLGYGTVASWARGAAYPQLNKLIPVCEIRGIDLVWLLFGEAARVMIPKPREKEEDTQRPARSVRGITASG